jgi:hypothetical protein
VERILLVAEKKQAARTQNKQQGSLGIGEQQKKTP